MNGEEHEIASGSTAEYHSSNSADNSPHLHAPLRREPSKVTRAKTFKARRESLTEILKLGNFDNPKRVRKGTSNYFAFDKKTRTWKDNSILANEYRAAHAHHGKRGGDEESEEVGESGSENGEAGDEIESKGPRDNSLQMSKSFESFQEASNHSLFDFDDEPPKQSMSEGDLLCKRGPLVYHRYSRFGNIPYAGWSHQLRMSQQFSAGRKYIESQAAAVTPNDSNNQIDDSTSNSSDSWSLNGLADNFESPVGKADFTLHVEPMDEIEEFVAPIQAEELKSVSANESSEIAQDIMNNTVGIVAESPGIAETWPIEEASDVQDFDVETLGTVSPLSQASEDEESGHENENETKASDSVKIEDSHVKAIIKMFHAKISEARNSGAPSNSNARLWLGNPESLGELVYEEIENGVNFRIHSDPPNFKSSLDEETGVDLKSVFSSENENIDDSDDDSEGAPSIVPETQDQSQFEAIEGFRVRMLKGRLRLVLDTFSPDSAGEQKDSDEEQAGHDSVEEFAESFHLSGLQGSEITWSGDEYFRDLESVHDESKSPDFGISQVNANISDFEPEEEGLAEEIVALEVIDHETAGVAVIGAAESDEAEVIGPEIADLEAAVEDDVHHEDVEDEVIEFETEAEVVADEHEAEAEVVADEHEALIAPAEALFVESEAAEAVDEVVDSEASADDHEGTLIAALEADVDLEDFDFENVEHEAVNHEDFEQESAAPEAEVFNPELAEAEEIVADEAEEIVADEAEEIVENEAAIVENEAEIVENEAIDPVVNEQEVVDPEANNFEYAVHEAVEQEVVNPEAAEDEILYSEAVIERGHDDSADEFDSPTLLSANGEDAGGDSDDESSNEDDKNDESQYDEDFFGTSKSKPQKNVDNEVGSSTINEITVPSKSGINLLNMFSFGYLSSSSSDSSTSDSSSSQSSSSSSTESSGSHSKQSHVVMRYPAPPAKKTSKSKGKQILNPPVPRSTPLQSNYFEILRSGDSPSSSSTKIEFEENLSEISAGNYALVGVILGISVLSIIAMGFIVKKAFRKMAENEFGTESDFN